MTNYIYSNPAGDAADTFAGIGSVFGNTILRSAMMRQDQATRQQQLAMDLARMQQQQAQFEQSHAQSADQFSQQMAETKANREQRLAESAKEDAEREARTEQLLLKNKELKTGQESTSRLQGIQQRFAEGVSNLGLPKITPPGLITPNTPYEQYPPGAPTLVNDQRMTQRDIAELIPPDKALDVISRFQAMQATPMTPTLGEQILTGRGFHNVPPQNVAVSPGGMPTYTNPAERTYAPTSPSQALNALNAAGASPEEIQAAIQVLLNQLGAKAPQTGASAPLTARNKEGARIISYDNGQTWSPITPVK